MSVWKAIGWFAGGILTGTAGLKALGSGDAKKVYTHAAAAALRCKDCTMESVTKIRENAEDIMTDAKKINEERAEAAEEAAEAQIIEDTSATVASDAETQEAETTETETSAAVMPAAE